MWRHGLGVWGPISQPFATYLDLDWLGASEPLIHLLGYVVLGYQLAFPVLVWFDRFRVPLVVVGIGMHLSIGIAFPIPLFGLVAAVFFLPLIPAPWYRRAKIPVADPQREVPPAGTPLLVGALGALWIVSSPIINIQSSFHRRYWRSTAAIRSPSSPCYTRSVTVDEVLKSRLRRRRKKDRRKT